jgi:ceramide glucosyltransferase
VILGGLALVWAAGYAAASLTAGLRALGRHARAGASSIGGEEASDTVVLVRPLAGDEPGLAARMKRTGGAALVVFAVGDRDDAAAPIAHEVVTELRASGIDAGVVVTGARGPNHKAAQLAIALGTPQARTRSTVVVADSDVDLGRDAVTRLVRAMGDAGAAWAPPVEFGAASTWGDRTSHAVLDASLHSFPLLAGIDRGCLVGKLFAVRRSSLDAIGGFDGLTTVLGEDMELARRLRRGGARIVVAPFVARAMATGRGLRDVLGRYARWLLVIRTQRAGLLLSYPLLIAPLPLLAALAVLGFARDDLVLVASAGAGLAVRLAVACAARALAGLRFAPLTALGQALLADTALLLALFQALTAREVTWRGRRLAIGKGGALGSRGAPSRREHANEQPLRERTEEARRSRDDRLEAQGTVGRASLDGTVDARELALDPVPLAGDAKRDVTRGLERRSDRDPEVRVLRAAEDVAKADREHDGAPGNARDLRGPRPEVELAEGRAFTPFGEHPERTPLLSEEARGVTDGASTVGRVVEIDPEGPHTPEERHASQVRRVHHRVAVGREQELGDVERDERVPPRRVVGDQQYGRPGDDVEGLVPSGHEDATERAPDARASVAREPRVEPATLRRRDHEVTS